MRIPFALHRRIPLIRRPFWQRDVLVERLRAIEQHVAAAEQQRDMFEEQLRAVEQHMAAVEQQRDMLAERLSVSHRHDESPRMPLDAREFLLSDFDARIRLVNQASNAHLWSSQLAVVWRDVLTHLEGSGVQCGAVVRKLTRELLVLAPDSAAAGEAYNNWMKDDGLRGFIPDPPIVYLVVSCEKYKQKALTLYEKIASHLSPAFIVIGDERIDEAIFSGSILTVPTPDNYESLPKKVLEALVAIRREFGKVGAVKIDDDAQFQTAPNSAAIRELVSSTEYAGCEVVDHPSEVVTGRSELLSGMNGFRCWHVGKCEYLKDEPYSKRYRGSWARGGLYYLGPSAVEFLVRDYTSFPGELAGEIYEDMVVADILRVHQITPSEARLSEIFGIGFPPHDATPRPPELLLTIDWRGADAISGGELREHTATAPTVEHTTPKLGDLRRVFPISGYFGYDRGKPVDRRYIEDFLSRNTEDIRGRVLEVGDNAYTVQFGGTRVQQSDVLHVDSGDQRATLVGDLAEGYQLPSQAFDCIVLTQTLQLVFDIRRAVATLYRMLKPGGVLLATAPGISSIDRGEWGPGWCWSLSTNALRRLLEESFDEENITVSGYGNVLAAIAFLHGLAESELSPGELDTYDPCYPVIVAARAVKGNEI